MAVGHHLDTLLEGKRQELCLLMKRPSHDSLFMLQNILAVPRSMCLLRTAPRTDSPIFPLFDAVIRESLSAILNVDLDGNRWHQASLPVRWGWSGRLQCGFAGTICLFGFSRKHLQAHIYTSTIETSRHARQWNRRRHVCVVKTSKQSICTDIYFVATNHRPFSTTRRMFTGIR
jgi:hypothetical protein